MAISNENQNLPQQRVSVKVIVTAVLLTIIMTATLTYYADFESNQTSLSQSYLQGNQTGYNLGLNQGNFTGVNLGFVEGNQTGYDQGYILGLAQGNQTGYSQGYIKGLQDGAGTGYTIRDPSYAEVQTIMAQDTIHFNVYNPDNYTCINFASDFANEAFAEGYRCGVVYIVFNDTTGHAINCFNTTDTGLVFIEPQSDEIVNLTIGQSYQPPGYEAMSIVNNFTITW